MRGARQYEVLEERELSSGLTVTIHERAFPYYTLGDLLPLLVEGSGCQSGWASLTTGEAEGGRVTFFTEADVLLASGRGVAVLTAVQGEPERLRRASEEAGTVRKALAGSAYAETPVLAGVVFTHIDRKRVPERYRLPALTVCRDECTTLAGRVLTALPTAGSAVAPASFADVRALVRPFGAIEAYDEAWPLNVPAWAVPEGVQQPGAREAVGAAPGSG
jgi:hypothetical protein